MVNISLGQKATRATVLIMSFWSVAVPGNIDQSDINIILLSRTKQWLYHSLWHTTVICWSVISCGDHRLYLTCPRQITVICWAVISCGDHSLYLTCPRQITVICWAVISCGDHSLYLICPRQITVICWAVISCGDHSLYLSTADYCDLLSCDQLWWSHLISTCHSAALW